MKTQRTYSRGRSIEGWSYGPRITDIAQLRAGDYLIGDSHKFFSTNLYRVTKIVRDPSETKPSRFLVIYVRPSRRKTGENNGMCVWFWEISTRVTSYYRALRT
jgi:hypothetical protein